MKIKNHQYYATIDNLGLKFVKCNSFVDAVNKKEDKYEYRLAELNELNLRFVMAIKLRHQVTDVNVTVAIFEEVL